MTSVRRAIVAGALAAKPGNAGGAWERFSYAVGLRRLGWDVLFLEQVAEPLSGVVATWFQECADWFDITAIAVTTLDAEAVRPCDLLINISGNVTCEAVLNAAKVTAYIDVDPGFTQIWREQGVLTIPQHDHYFTIGENIGKPSCPLPTGGLHWKPTRQPVVLDQWPIANRILPSLALQGGVGGGSTLPPSETDVRPRKASPSPGPSLQSQGGVEEMPDALAARCFSTISSWRSFGAVTWNGVTYSQKHHEFRRFIELPRQINADIEIALDIHPGDAADQQKLIHHGWHINCPAVINTPAAFREFIQQSAAEFSVCQGVYSAGRSGWFSDRSVRYLASGKPVLVPDTASPVPAGKGLVTFTTLDEAVAGAEAILTDYDRHAVAARRLAEEWFDSDRVLTKLLNDCGLEVR